MIHRRKIHPGDYRNFPQVQVVQCGCGSAAGVYQTSPETIRAWCETCGAEGEDHAPEAVDRLPALEAVGRKFAAAGKGA